jgi:hypothetical protein
MLECSNDALMDAQVIIANMLVSSRTDSVPMAERFVGLDLRYGSAMFQTSMHSNPPKADAPRNDNIESIDLHRMGSIRA